jgi:hypothetical protein
MRSLFLALALLVLPAISAAAQTPPISAVRIIVLGGVSPVTNDLQIGNVTCGVLKTLEPPVDPGVTHNATEIDFDDPLDNAPATHYCRYKDTWRHRRCSRCPSVARSTPQPLRSSTAAQGRDRHRWCLTLSTTPACQEVWHPLV